MTTILDTIRITQQLEQAARKAFGVPTLTEQLARAAKQAYPRDDFSRLTAAVDQFRALDSLLRDAQIQIQSRDDLLGGFTSGLAAPALEAGKSIGAMLQSLAIAKRLPDIGLRTAPDWAQILRATDALGERTTLPVEAHLTRLYQLSAVAEASLRRVSPESLGRRLALTDREQADLAARQDELGREYSRFYADVTSKDSKILELPKLVTEAPATEFVNQAALVVATSEVIEDELTSEAQREISDELATETADHLSSLIANLDPDLLQLLHGARAAVDARHPDYVRHFATSLRELFTQVLHRLSPDEQVRKWTNDPKHYDDKHRPTRRCRLLYITRTADDVFGGFLNANVDAMTPFIDLFQKGTHGVRPEFTDDQVDAMVRRMEGLLRAMLVIYQIG